MAETLPDLTRAGAERQRAGGRSERIRHAVGEAVLELLAEGELAFTMIQVAERAEVSRRTLYRWWPDMEDLLAEALAQHTSGLEAPDSGSWATDVEQMAARVVAFSSSPIDLALARIMATGQYPGFNAAVEAQFSGPLAELYAVHRRAVERGEARPDQSSRSVIHLLISPLFLAPLSTGVAARPDVVRDAVALVLAATAP